PAILVPWAASAEDHQTANVRWLSDVGGAVHVEEDAIDRLLDEVERLRADPTARERLSARARERGAVHRSGLLAELIESVAA
ncbi:MAG: hypothetical protein HKN41_05495, partial [Ilumatobacter sp.]|nr:hypothetical protein [Ilumatobacter sp.]